MADDQVSDDAEQNQTGGEQPRHEFSGGTYSVAGGRGLTNDDLVLCLRIVLVAGQEVDQVLGALGAALTGDYKNACPPFLAAFHVEALVITDSEASR